MPKFLVYWVIDDDMGACPTVVEAPDADSARKAVHGRELGSISIPVELDSVVPSLSTTRLLAVVESVEPYEE